MSLQVLINNNSDPSSDYITWTPTPCKIVSSDATAVNVKLSNKNTSGGQISFSSSAAVAPANTITLTVPANGSADFFIAGKFNLTTGKSFPSKNDKDAIIKISHATTNAVLGEKTLMVRVRKNANDLSAAERDRFLDAMVKLNLNQTYLELQNMHLGDNSMEIHGRSCFLAWHRGFLLDLERRLQQINPAVSLPYWDFAKKAPKIFKQNFMGLPDNTGMVSFSNTNPLINWKSLLFGAGDGTRIRREFESTPGAGSIPWNPNTQRAVMVLRNETQTLALGNSFDLFTDVEGEPHGSAHVSFLGQINDIGTAPADPLFFLLHCNIDRLWAKWQWQRDRFDPTQGNAYTRQGNGNPASSGELGIGNFTNDTMWPWNGITGPPRPPHVAGTGMIDSPLTVFPGRQPRVGNMIDYQGQVSLANNLHFAYNDVPYEF